MPQDNQDRVLFYITTGIGFSYATSVLKDGISYQKSSNFQQTNILNRSSPVITYSGSNAITLSVNLELYAINDSALEIIPILESFTSLTFPYRPGILPPPLCWISCPGFKMLREWECVCNSVDSRWNGPWDENGLPMTAIVGLQFLGVERENVATEQWLDAGDYTALAWNQG